MVGIVKLIAGIYLLQLNVVIFLDVHGENVMILDVGIIIAQRLVLPELALGVLRVPGTLQAVIVMSHHVGIMGDQVIMKHIVR
tara:strand:+ start:224 stop:472 length:249 start_codon:yes stop_codon:yes gene_type:complete